MTFVKRESEEDFISLFSEKLVSSSLRKAGQNCAEISVFEPF